jgi:sterol desaturase/sphingolipid hydroxylase (fatty acid hydroxylase superfamily)
MITLNCCNLIAARYFCTNFTSMIASFRETLLFLISTPLYVIFIGLELLISTIHRHHRYSAKGTWQNFYIMLISMAIDFGMRVVALFCLTTLFHFHTLQLNNVMVYWILLFLLQDLAFYTMHFVDHKVRLFWAVHVTHHSSEEFNLGVGFRSSVFEPIYRFIYFIPIVLLGFEPLDVFFVFSITQLYGIFIHTQYVRSLGVLEWFMATPSHHRVHHGRNPKYIDRNMGMFLIVWDRLFGTFEPETEPVVYGITNPPKSNRPDEVILHEFRNIAQDVKRAPDMKSKLMYIFGPPGWHPQQKK